MIITEDFLRFICILGVMLFFGLTYTYLVVRKSFRPKWTSLGVLIGDSISDFGMSALLWLVTENLFVALVPWLVHGLTGGPMIMGQAIKHTLQDGGIIEVEDDDDTAPPLA